MNLLHARKYFSSSDSNFTFTRISLDCILPICYYIEGNWYNEIAWMAWIHETIVLHKQKLKCSGKQTIWFRIKSRFLLFGVFFFSPSKVNFREKNKNTQKWKNQEEHLKRSIEQCHIFNVTFCFATTYGVYLWIRFDTNSILFSMVL